MKKFFYSFLALSLALVMLINIISVGNNLIKPSHAEDKNSLENKPKISETQMSSEEQDIRLSFYDGDGQTFNFDSDWKFHHGEDASAKEPNFNDAKWKDINLPHDYSLEQAYTPNAEAESGYKMGGIGWYRKSFSLGESFKNKKVYINFDGAYMKAEVYLNGQKLAFHPYGYTPFRVDISDNIKIGEANILAVKTDNPVPTSRWYSGSGLYRSVYLEKHDKIHFADYGVQFIAPNLENKMDKTALVIKAKILNESEEQADLKLHLKIKEKATGHSLYDEEISRTSFNIEAGQNSEQNFTDTNAIQIPYPKLWSVDEPMLYLVELQLIKNGQVVDSYQTDYGFRYFKFDKDEGFSLNGQKMKLKGLSMHHDQGGLGASAYYDAIERQVLKLKAMGANSIRVTHNPAAQHLLDIANKHGMLLIEEAFDGWQHKKNRNNDYTLYFEQQIGSGQEKLVGASTNMKWSEFDLKQMVKRGRNMPSIIAWSLGNEVMEGNSGNFSPYPELTRQLSRWTKEVDDTRPITVGQNKLKTLNNNIAYGIADAVAQEGGIIGFNYASNRVANALRNKYKNYPVYGSETSSAVNSRGIYKVTRQDAGFEGRTKQLTSYDNRAVPWGETARTSWYTVIKNDWMAGEYIWTGFDYLGEPTPWNGDGGSHGGWPSPKSSYFGIIDTAGFPKDTFYFYHSQWHDKERTLHILPEWKREEVAIDRNGNVPVYVYSDASSVELFLTPKNGERKSLGKKSFSKQRTQAGYEYQYVERDNADNLAMKWDVKYEDGILEAVAYDENDREIENTIGKKRMESYANAAKLHIEANKKEIVADPKSLVYLEIEVRDQNNLFVANSDARVNIEVEGAGKLIAMDNGDAVDHQSYQENNRKAFRGKVLAIIQANGKEGTINIKAKSNGLEEANISIKAIKKENAVNSEVKALRYARNIYVKKGSEPVLPNKIKLVMANDDILEKNVNFTLSESDKEKLKKGTSFTLNGKVENVPSLIPLNIIPLDEFAGLLNYATVVALGAEKPVLPSTRPLIGLDGEILSLSLDVKWQEIPELKEVGITKIKGEAYAFSKTYEVEASIRVSELTRAYGDNVAPFATTLTEDTESGKISDTLKAITDGRTNSYPNTSGGANPYAWTNYASAQAGDKETDITFTYSTVQNIGKIEFYFFKDSYAATYPENVEVFYNTGTGENVKAEGELSELTNTNDEKVKTRTFVFKKPVAALNFILRLTNADEAPDRNAKACTGLTEVKLLLDDSRLEKKSLAKLTGMTINGIKASTAALLSKELSTESYKADFEIINENHAAYNILSPFENKIKILTESEDQKRREIYTINLGQEFILKADDDSLDLPIDKLTFKSDYTERRSGNEIENAKDDNPNTLWHTNWSGVPEGKLYIDIEVDADLNQSYDTLRYLPRKGENNGRVKKYEICELNENNECAKILGTGEWADNSEWQLAKFNERTTAKKIRLKALESYGTSQTNTNRFMSAAEIRLSSNKEKIDLSPAEIKLEETYEYTGREIKPVPLVKLDEINLREGYDFIVEYSNNIEKGKGTLTVRGLAKYKGDKTAEFNIVAPKKKPEKIDETPEPNVEKPKTEDLDYKIFSKELTKEDKKIEVLIPNKIQEILKVEEILVEQIKYKKLDNVEAFDISLLNDKKEKITNFKDFKAKVRIKLDDKKEFLDVRYIPETGKEISLEERKIIKYLDSNFVEFSVHHFSVYAIYYKNKVAKIENKIKGNNIIYLSTKKTQENLEIKKDKQPNTSAVNKNYIIILLLFIIIFCILWQE